MAGSHTLNGMDPLRAVEQERKAEKRLRKLQEHTLEARPRRRR